MSRMKPGARGARGEGGSSSRSTKTTIVEGCNNSPQHRSLVKLDIRDVQGSGVCDAGVMMS